MEATTKVQALVTEWLKLDADERRQFATATGQVSKKALQAHMQSDYQLTDAELLWEALRHESMRLEGYPLPPLASLLGMVSGATISSCLNRSVAWLTSRATATTTLDRRIKLALYRLAGEAVIKTYPIRSTSWVYLVEHITDAVEVSYPGYQANDMLVPVAEQIAVGNLPGGVST